MLLDNCSKELKFHKPRKTPACKVCQILLTNDNWNLGAKLNSKYICIEHERERSKINEQTIRGTIHRLLRRAKSNAKNRGWEFDLNYDFVLNILEKGICQISGITFIYISYHRFRPSIDRIDNNKGYTKNNVQIVVKIYNYLKNRYSDEDCLDFLKQFAEYKVAQQKLKEYEI